MSLVQSGFRAAGLACGIKSDGSLDLALIAADRPAAVAGVFTTSAVAAAPVLLTRRRVAGGVASAVVVNSGIANAGTGAAGLRDAEAMAAAVATHLGCEPSQVLVCSTGTIGKRLPIDRIVESAESLVAALSGGAEADEAASRAIMTTDTRPKSSRRSRPGYAVGGIAKGAGMIRPDMATMLAFLTTDADVDPVVLHQVLARAVRRTFNALNVDGCQSTNDTVLLLASGTSGVIPDVDELEESVEQVCADLAHQIADDAEGATRVVTIEVRGARSDDDARRIGMTVADSDLVRASFYGADPNWGRVFAAVGVAGVDVDPEGIDVSYDGITVCRGSQAVAVDEDALSAGMAGDFVVEVSVGGGPGTATILTTDLTPEYVVFNGERS